MNCRKRVKQSNEKFRGRGPYVRWMSRSERERVDGWTEMDEKVGKKCKNPGAVDSFSPMDGIYAEIFSRASELEIERRALDERSKVKARIKKKKKRW